MSNLVSKNEKRQGWLNQFFNQSGNEAESGETFDKSKLLRIIGWYHSWAKKKILKLEAEVDHWKKLATTDALTGISNRRYVEDALTQSGNRRTSVGAQILYIDLKKFKQINDTYGHNAGDEALRTTALFLKSHVRDSDIVGRMGGDEFIVILEGADKNAALQKVRDIESGFQTLTFDHNGTEINIRGSVGHYEVEDEGMPVEKILEQSDMAMYRAKNTPDPAFA